MMKLLVFILTLIFCTGNVSAQKQKQAVKFLKKADKRLHKLQNVSYNAVYQYKSSYDSHKLQFKASLKYSLNPRDFFFGYDLWYSDKKYYEGYYSLGKSYNIDRKSKKIYPFRFLDPKKTNLKAGPFAKNSQDGVFAVFLKDKDFFRNIINDDSYRLTMLSKGFCPDTVHIRADYIYQNTKLLPDTVWGLSYDFYFIGKTGFPVIIKTKGVNSKGDFHSELKLWNVAVNKDSIRDFFLKYEFPADFMMINNNVKKTHMNTNNVKKIKAPDFIAVGINGEEIKLSDFKGKVVLLDFWYSTCAPCIKASAFINNFADKYTDSGLVVLGMDPFDGISKIKQHNQKWNIKYPGVKCTEKTKNDYDINSFPTFILIDKNGMIIYRASGFSKSIINQIEQHIQKAVGQ